MVAPRILSSEARQAVGQVERFTAIDGYRRTGRHPPASPPRRSLALVSRDHPRIASPPQPVTSATRRRSPSAEGDSTKPRSPLLLCTPWTVIGFRRSAAACWTASADGDAGPGGADRSPGPVTTALLLRRRARRLRGPGVGQALPFLRSACSRSSRSRPTSRASPRASSSPGSTRRRPRASFAADVAAVTEPRSSGRGGGGGCFRAARRAAQPLGGRRNARFDVPRSTREASDP